MSFIETLESARSLLERNRRVSLRALRLQFSLGEEELGALVEELVDVQQVASLTGKVLAWIGPASLDAGVRTPTAAPAPGARSSVGRGERRPLTVLFCDIVGSTDLSTRIDEETLRDVIRAYHESSAEAIERLDGHIAQYLGDGLLVYFGYPQARENDPERAVRAGLATIAALDALNARLERGGMPPLQLRIGIHTGPVVVGEVGGGHRREVHAIGETMNLAARIQGEAEPDEVVVSPATLRLVRGLFVTRDLGSRSLKGIGAMHVHRVLRPTGARSRLDVEPERLTRLVGREHELGLLVEGWETAKKGEGRGVLIEGEAGLGKSRLLRALRQKLADDPHTWLECQCSRDRQRSAFHPLVELIAQEIGLDAEDSPEAKLRRLEAALERVGLASPESLALFARVLSLPLPDGPPPPEDSGDLQRKKTIEALCAWVLALSRAQPLAMVVEDLHWCDPSTLEFLTLLEERSPGSPILMLLSHRPESGPLWPERPQVLRLELQRLAPSQAERLIGSLSAERTLPDRLVVRIVERADGVPLFLEELTKMVLETGMGEEGDGSAATDEAIPATLQGSLMARLDRLGPGKRVAQLGAVLGRRFPYALMGAVWGDANGGMDAGLDALVDSELLHTRGIPPDAEYSFKHALVQDAAHQSLLRSEATWMGLYFHHQMAGDLARAEKCARSALDLAEQSASPADVLTARFSLSQSLYMQGDFVAALHALDPFIRLDESGARDVELAAGHREHSGTGTATAPRSLALRAGGGPTAPSQGRLHAGAWGVRALTHWALGRPDRALDICQAVLEAAQQVDLPFNSAVAYIYLGWIHQKRGERGPARRAAQEAFDLCERFGFSWLAWTRALRGSVALDPGSAHPLGGERAVADIERGIEELLSAGTHGWIPHCYSALAEVCWRLGRHDQAL